MRAVGLLWGVALVMGRLQGWFMAAYALGKFPPPCVVWCSFGVASDGEVLASRL